MKFLLAHIRKMQNLVDVEITALTKVAVSKRRLDVSNKNGVQK